MDATRQLREDAAACDFVAQFLDDRERGVARELADYQACFPEFRERIAAEFAALQHDAASPAELLPDVGRDVGPYRLLERLGQGGQGIVFRAEHRELKRTVALKMLHRGVLGLSALHRARLRREAISVARLDHPAICPVYEVELDGPEPYLAMRFVSGRSLAVELERARQARGDRGEVPLPPRARSEIEAWLAFFEGAAAGLHAAHLVGIVHRDVKPHNLMRTVDGEPVLLDFGLARDVTSTSGALTGSHELFGTLAYMAPELLAGGVEPNPRHDVYSLGAALYEVMTLQQPFAAATPEALWRRIASGDVAPARSVNTSLPRELDVVVATALERDPARRYPTAQALAEDLRRLRLREPILARPLDRWRRALRWGRRHPVVCVAALLLTAGFLVSLALLREVWRSRDGLERANIGLERSNRDLNAAQQAYRALSLSEVRPGEALRSAVEAARLAPQTEVSNVLLRVLDRCDLARTETLVRNGKAETCETLACDAKGDCLAVPCMTGEVMVVDVASGAPPIWIAAHTAGRTLASFRGDTQQLLTAGADGVLRSWRPGATTPEREWTTRGGARVSPANALAVSADGRRAAVGGADGSIVVFDLVGDGPPVACPGHAENVSGAVFDPTGRFLVTFSRDWHRDLVGDGSVRIFDATTGAALSVFDRQVSGGPLQLGLPRDIAWSVTGSSLAIAWDNKLFLMRRPWTDDGGSLGALLDPGGTSKVVAFDPRRLRLWVGGDYGLAVCDTDANQIVYRERGFGDRAVTQFAFHPERDEVAVLAFDGKARIYDAANPQLRRTLIADSRINALRWVGGGRLLAALCANSLFFFYNGQRPFLPNLEGHTDRVVQVHFDGTGERVLSASHDGTARIWESKRGTPLVVLSHGPPLRTARFSAHGDRIVTSSERGRPRVWTLEPPDWKVLGETPTNDAWFCDDDRRIVTTDDQGWVRTYDANTGDPLGACWLHDTGIESAAWHPTQPWLVTGAGRRTVSVFDCISQRETFRSEPWQWEGSETSGNRVLATTFSSDGQGIFAVGTDLRIHGWRLDSPREWWVAGTRVTAGSMLCVDGGRQVLVGGIWSPALVALRPGDTKSCDAGHAPGNSVSCLRADASGRRVLCADKAGRVAVFDVSPWREVLTIRASEAPVIDADWDPAGTSIVTGDMDGRVRVWPVDPLPVAERVLSADAGFPR